VGGLDVGAPLRDPGGDDRGLQTVLERLDLDLDAALGVGHPLAQASGGVALGALAVLGVGLQLAGRFV
jgi:hypothetical protein